VAASKTIGGINVTITASVDKFQKGMKTAQKILLGFTRSIKNAVFSLKGFAAALAMGAFVKLTHSTMESIAAMGDLSDKLGVSTEKLAGLQLAAEEAGISNTVLEKSLTTLSNEMGMSGDKALRAWIEKTSKLTSQQEKLAAATAMFGSRGSSMVRFLNGGVGALDEAQKAAEGMGLALSRESVIGVDRALEAFERLKKIAGGIFRQLAIDMSPYIEVMNTKLGNFLTEGGKAKGIGSAISDAVIGAAKFVADAIQKMVGGVLSMVADVKQAMVAFRTSKWAVGLGMGYSSNSAIDAASTSAYESWYRADRFNSAPKWSTGIESAAAAARKAAAADVSTRSAGRGMGGVFRNLGEQMMTSNAARNMADLFDAVKGLPKAAVQGIGKLQWDLMMGQFGGGRMKAGSTGSSSLSFAESGSVESYRQQAAIRRQGEQLQKKQLQRQTDMLAQLKEINKKTMPVLEARL
jgi:hypothetical protein